MTIFRLLVVAFASISLTAFGATYYVDPADGSDANAGTSTLQAWKNVPGTYNWTNTAFLTPTDGWKKLSAGDTVYIKRGTTITNRLFASSTWWNQGSNGAPITMTTTAWGSGPVVWDMTLQTLGIYDSALYFYRLPFITIDGVTSGGFVISNSWANGVQFYGTNPTNQTEGLIAKNMTVVGMTNIGMMFYNQTNYYAANIEIDGQHRSPACGGMWNGMWAPDYNCDNGVITNCFVHDIGDTTLYSQWGGASYNIGFWSCNIRNVKFIDCVSSNNVGDGYDLGGKARTGVPISDNVYFIRCKALRNNGDGFGANFNDVATWNLSDTNIGRFYYFNCLAVSNVSGINAYNGPWVYSYNNTFAFNQYGMLIDGGMYPGYLPYTNRTTMGTVRNTLFYQNNGDRSGGSNYGDLVSSSTNIVFDIDHNLFDQGLGSEKMVRWNFDGYAGTYKSYYYSTDDAQNIKLWRTNTGADMNSLDSVELGGKAGFADTNTWPYSLLLTSTSSARSAGQDLTAIWPVDVPKTDIRKNTITTWDIGAYQYGAYELPVITVQPSTVVGNVGIPATMIVAATGADPITYQWYKGGVAISGATSATFEIGSCALSDFGSYYCVVTNPGGSVQSSMASINVFDPKPRGRIAQ